MSLVVTLVTLAEGAASDSRGGITLVAANPQFLTAERFPAQLAPVFYAAVEDGEEGAQPPSIVPGRVVSLKLQVTAPDGEVLYFFQNQQSVLANPHPVHPIRLQVLVPVQFSASKSGDYTISARLAIALPGGEQDEVVATRRIRVIEQTPVKSEPI